MFISRLIKFTISLFIVSILAGEYPPLALAESNDNYHLVINELYPIAAEGENEWIELYNPTQSSIDLSGYTVTDLNGAKILTLSGSIEAENFLLLSDLPFVLNNDSDSIFLKNETEIIDQVSYGDIKNNPQNAPLPANQKSISRVPDGSDTNINSNDFKVVIPSPGEKYQPKEYSEDIRINEFFPYPSEGTRGEFVELYNKGVNEISLKYWSIDDEADGSIPFSIIQDVVIEPAEYIVFYNSDTNIILNNDNDQVRLINPNNIVADTVSYSNAKEGMSFSYFDDGWEWTTPTPLSENKKTQIITAEPEVKVIKNIKKLADNITIKTTGTVTAVPGLLSSQYFYIEDDYSGIQIYSYTKSFPKLEEGEKVSVIGKMSTVAGERRVKTSNASDIVKLSEEANIFDPVGISLDKFSDDLVGLYVISDGVVENPSGSEFGLVSPEKVKVIIRPETKIIKEKTREGDHAVIAGILSKYNDTYRILPFHPKDVKIIASGELPLAGENTPIYWCISVGTYLIFVLWNIYQKIQRRHENWG